MFWFLRIRVALFGLSLLLAGVGAVFSTAKKASIGVETSAILLSRTETCEVSLRRGKSTAEVTDCENARRVVANHPRAFNLKHVKAVRLRYEDQQGETHYVTANAQFVPDDAEPGDAVAVSYDPQQPETLVAPASAGGLTGALLLTMLGGGLICWMLKFNPLRLVSAVAKAGVEVSGAVQERIGQNPKWVQAADEAIARRADIKSLLEREPLPEAAPVAPVYSPPGARGFGRRGLAR